MCIFQNKKKADGNILYKESQKNHIVSGGQKKTHRTLDACRFQSIYSIDMIFHICIAQSVLSYYRKFCLSNPICFHDNV